MGECGKALFNRIFWPCMNALNNVGFSLDLLVLHAMVHFARLGQSGPIQRIFLYVGNLW